ncbi:MAG TPA: type II toxin-antitoxin system VapC family toxin [Verrucomicrobiae bacterium]
MKRLVVDGSVAVSWFLEDENSEYARKVRAKIPDTEIVSVPNHWMLEVVNALMVAERRKRIAPASVNHAVGILRQLPIHSDSETDEHAGQQTLELARQHTLSIYDAAYLELALRLGAFLASLDEPLKAAASKRGVPLA